MTAFFCVFRPHSWHITWYVYSTREDHWISRGAFVGATCGNLTRKAAKGAVTGAKPTPRAFSAEIDISGIKRNNGTKPKKNRVNRLY